MFCIWSHTRGIPNEEREYGENFGTRSGRKRQVDAKDRTPSIIQSTLSTNPAALLDATQKKTLARRPQRETAGAFCHSKGQRVHFFARSSPHGDAIMKHRETSKVSRSVASFILTCLRRSYRKSRVIKISARAQQPRPQGVCARARTIYSS
jgi:hypothetical protein